MQEDVLCAAYSAPMLDRTRRALTPARERLLVIARASMLAAVLALGVLFFAAAAGAEEATKAPPAPANDTLAGAQVIHALPASLNGTTVGATTEAGEPATACGEAIANSVWYSLRVTSAHRIALQLAASGALDATVDVYHAVRSQLSSVTCQQTEGEGKASLSFEASKNGLYEIKVAALVGSALAPFTLEVFQPTPGVTPPGAPLPPAGVSGQVDRIQNVNAAYSFLLHSGVSYIINLTSETKGGACVSGALFGPGTTSFGGEEEEQQGGSLLQIQCGGYRLFTPGAGQGGLYSLDITPRFSHRGVQRFHLLVAPAGPGETAPGLGLPNYGVERGHLDGHGVPVLRLYRMEVTTRSNLTLKLTAPATAEFKLQLRDEGGNVIECDCEGSGSLSLAYRLAPGTYYAVVVERNHTSGNFSLLRESRTITSTSISFGAAKAAPGQALAIQVKVKPAESGPVSIEIQRFDPVFGWQYYREEHIVASEGLATVPFTPPAAGQWRAKATYQGSRVASPSAVGFSYLNVS
jgi:hypothetical protein